MTSLDRASNDLQAGIGLIGDASGTRTRLVSSGAAKGWTLIEDAHPSRRYVFFRPPGETIQLTLKDVKQVFRARSNVVARLQAEKTAFVAEMKELDSPPVPNDVTYSSSHTGAQKAAPPLSETITIATGPAAGYLVRGSFNKINGVVTYRFRKPDGTPWGGRNAVIEGAMEAGLIGAELDSAKDELGLRLQLVYDQHYSQGVMNGAMAPFGARVVASRKSMPTSKTSTNGATKPLAKSRSAKSSRSKAESVMPPRGRKRTYHKAELAARKRKTGGGAQATDGAIVEELAGSSDALPQFMNSGVPVGEIPFEDDDIEYDDGVSDANAVGCTDEGVVCVTDDDDN